MITAVNEAIKSIWDTIKEQDKSLVVYPWSEGSRERSITKFKHISDSSLSEIQEYFIKAAPREKGGTLYFSAHLGHDKPFKKLHNDVADWMGRSDVQAGWWYKTLQCEQTTAIGWFLYSPREIDTDMLAAAILKQLGVKVGLRFKTIAVQQGRQLLKDEMIMALHVDIDSRFETVDRLKIETMYDGHRTKGWPLGIKLQLVPERRDVSVPETYAKLDHTRARQEAFLANLRRFDDIDIAVLDFVDHGLGSKSLRQLIMEIPSTRNPNKQLFVSVD